MGKSQKKSVKKISDGKVSIKLTGKIQKSIVKRKQRLKNRKDSRPSTKPVVATCLSETSHSTEKDKQKKKKDRLVISTGPSSSLRDRMMHKLQGARFRFLNEVMYTSEGKDAKHLFKKDPQSFQAYHEGYKKQVTQWKLNPLDNIIANLRKKSNLLVIADFGCGDARLASSLPNKVYSFDLVALNDRVTECDMAHVPLQDCHVDIVIFCLSLMGTNLSEYLLEANRVLKLGGILKIAEVESRFDDINKFISNLKKYGFHLTSKNLSNSFFYFLDFKKEASMAGKSKLPAITLRPCVYKKR